jgi:murein DD-endopeptidase MepM/ murein hydrolase activator NlpD
MVFRLNNLIISIPIIFFSFLFSSCGTVYEKPPSISKDFGTPVLYKDKKHPGVDYNVHRNTPIIACSNGTVLKAYKTGSDKPWEGGYFVMVKHGHYLGKPFFAEYFHLSKIYVSAGENISRGELIGLSGASNDGNIHLHFGLHFGVTGFGNHYDPKDFWLEKNPECFDSLKDYSAYSDTELTHPIACGSYAKEITVP